MKSNVVFPANFNPDSARKYLRNHVQKGEHAGTETVCLKLGVKTQEELFSLVEFLYQNDATGSMLISELKKNDENINKRLRRKAATNSKKKVSVIQTAATIIPEMELKETKEQMLDELKKLSEKRFGIEQAIQETSSSLANDFAIVENIKQQLDELEKKSQKLLEQISKKSDDVKKLKDTLKNIETEMAKKDAEIKVVSQKIEEAESLHISITAMPNTKCYSKIKPTLSNKFELLIQLMQFAEKQEDSFLKDLLNSSTQEENLMVAEEIFCYRQEAKGSERKVYWHCAKGPVAEILELVPEMIPNLVIEEGET